ncbi:MAG TPA: hypothetical protein VE783_10975 [Candidatus Limnocylindrales bacterium]|nr:hypothetical protein [Candidatus Limnocylindrales bacterium]
MPCISEFIRVANLHSFAAILKLEVTSPDVPFDLYGTVTGLRAGVSERGVVIAGIVAVVGINRKLALLPGGKFDDLFAEQIDPLR